MSNWIDYKSLRAKLSFVEVLRHFNVEAKIKGDRATALCPLPGHPAHAGEGKRTASLSVHLSRNIFQCFGCKASGNVLDFCIRMEGADPADAKQFRQAAIKVAQTFQIESGEAPPSPKPLDQERIAKVLGSTTRPARRPSFGTTAATASSAISTPQPPVIVNAPLDFELKLLDPSHAYLTSRGFTPETIAHFGLGYCAKGMMKDRIAIPLHDAEGKLIGYAGRIVDDDAIDHDHPKYLFPGPREREGKRYEFHKSLLLYSLHRIERPADELIVVEGFASVWWLHQHGFPNSVALMGSSCSPEQARLLSDSTKRVLILSDGDEAGSQCVDSVWHAVGTKVDCRNVFVQEGKQPTDLSADDLDQLLTFT